MSYAETMENNKKQVKQPQRKFKEQAIYIDGTSVPLQSLVKSFAQSEEDKLVLPGLTKDQRKDLRNYARHLGLKSRTHEFENDRVMSITRPQNNLSRVDAYKLELTPTTRDALFEILPSLRAHWDVVEKNLRHYRRNEQSRWRGEPYLTGLGPRVIPPLSGRISHQMNEEKKELPIFAYQEEILKMLRQNPIVIINGETGSGKSTQVPQYILQDAAQRNRACRIIVTQPRRVAVVSIAQRVAEERGEMLGKTVGFQIRLENRMRRTSNLIYTTSGCLLRSIMANMDDLFQNVTHLIIDEIHERDKYTDFTLIALKKHLKRNSNLRVILMSATMNIKELSAYFDNCPVLNVPGQGYDVKIFHLEDILYYTGYRTNIMQLHYNSMTANNEFMCGTDATNAIFPIMTANDRIDITDNHLQQTLDILMDKLLHDLSEEELLEIFDQIPYHVESEGMPIDAAHSNSGITPLMAACRANLPRYVEIFLNYQADPYRCDMKGKSAFHYASLHIDNICKQLLENKSQIPRPQIQLSNEDCEKQRLLYAYQAQFFEDNDVDHDLILSLLEGLYRSLHPGAIMVFLPGYNDIVQQRDLINCTLPPNTYRICIMHSQMDSQDQCAALRPSRVRKIILSTNIAQTSITIPDLAYIIDCGKVKMKTYDSITDSSQLRSVWISQSDANQRAGRAGRTQNGICYRLYSNVQYQRMSNFCCPEFMRISLTEICLFAKSLDEQNDVQDFLSYALNPPSAICVRHAVKKLKIIDVFDENEVITALGRHLVEMPLDIQLGKCLLYGIYMRCWEPILTIVAFHSIKDPFILPTDRALQGPASFQRKSLAGNTFSDQKGILELYKNYLLVRNHGRKAREFCTKYFLSASCMEQWIGTRHQIRQLILRKFNLTNSTTKEFNWNVVRFCLVVGFYPNVALLNRSKNTLVCGMESGLQLQRTSALMPPGMKNLKNFKNSFPHDWLVFFEKAQLTRSCSINMNTLVPPLMVALACGKEQAYVDDEQDQEQNEMVATNDLNNMIELIASSFKTMSLDSTSSLCEENALLQLDDWIQFELIETDARLLSTLRALLQTGFLTFLRNGHTNFTIAIAECVNRLLDTIVEPTVPIEAN